jgi:hypothetical protein
MEFNNFGSDIDKLRREMDTLNTLLSGKTRQRIITPSGLEGFNLVYEAIASPEGALLVDGSSLSPFCVVAVGDGFQIVNGILVNTIIPYLTMKIKGLGKDLKLGNGTKVWLEVKIDGTLKSTEAEVKSGRDWPAYATYNEASPYVQTKATCRIGHAVSGELPAGTPGFNFTQGNRSNHFLQQLTTNLCMTACAVDGKATMLPLPFAG